MRSLFWKRELQDCLLVLLQISVILLFCLRVVSLIWISVSLWLLNLIRIWEARSHWLVIFIIIWLWSCWSPRICTPICCRQSQILSVWYRLQVSRLIGIICWIRLHGIWEIYLCLDFGFFFRFLPALWFWTVCLELWQRLRHKWICFPLVCSLRFW